jgi:predicted AAA+ superfamily ATPase
MAEIALSVLVRQCLDRRIASPEELEREALAWQHERNDATVKIAWTFTTQKARVKFQRHYKKLNPNN